MRTLLAEPCPPSFLEPDVVAPPRVGLLGFNESDGPALEALARSGAAEIVAVTKSALDVIPEPQALPCENRQTECLNDLGEVELDGVVIATPNALHADLAVTALERGVAVFLRHPWQLSPAETDRIVKAARTADRLLGVNLSYRLIPGIRRIHELCRSGELGRIYAVDLAFHATQPRDRSSFADGSSFPHGCVTEFGAPLLDLALWNLEFPAIANVASRLFAAGMPLTEERRQPEDYAEVRLDTVDGATIRLACSSKTGKGDALISGTFHGTQGTAAFRNIYGSLSAFRAESFCGTHRETMAPPAKPWSGCAMVDWARRLADDGTFDPEIKQVCQVAHALAEIFRHPHQQP